MQKTVSRNPKNIFVGRFQEKLPKNFRNEFTKILQKINDLKKYSKNKIHSNYPRSSFNSSFSKRTTFRSMYNSGTYTIGHGNSVFTNR